MRVTLIERSVHVQQNQSGYATAGAPPPARLSCSLARGHIVIWPSETSGRLGSTSINADTTNT